MTADTARTCLVVDAVSTGRHLPAALAGFGLRTVHVQSRPDLPVYVAKSKPTEAFADEFVVDGNLDAVVEQAAEMKPEFCIPGAEIRVMMADTLSERLGLPGNGTALSLARRDKFAMGEALAAAGLRRIEQTLADDPEAVIAWMAEHRIPEAVIKPRDSAGTDSVFFCRTPGDVRTAMAAIVGRFNSMGSFNDKALAQRRIRGRQFTVNTVSIDGEAYIAECWTYETVEVPGAGSICSHEVLLDGGDPVALRLGAYVRQVLAALGVRHGPAHVEVFEDEDGPVLIECGARMQGSMSRPATLQALGHDHVALTALRYADPEGFRDYVAGNDPYRPRRPAWIVSLLSDVAGRVTGHSGLERIRALPTFADAVGFAPVGAEIRPTRDLYSTPGIVYLVGEDIAALERDYRAIRAMGMAEVFDLA